MHLGDVCSIRSGLTIRERLSDVREGGVLAVQQGDLTAAGTFDPTRALRIAAPSRSLHSIRSHELVFRSRGPFWSAWAPGDFGEPLVAVAPLFILSPAPDIDATYLAWYIGRPRAQRYLSTEAVGSSVLLISRAVLERLPLDVPPLDTQRTIAAAAGLAARERELTDELAGLTHDRLTATLDDASRRSNSTPQ